jgi:hypothetical protein
MPPLTPHGERANAKKNDLMAIELRKRTSAPLLGTANAMRN